VGKQRMKSWKKKWKGRTNNRESKTRNETLKGSHFGVRWQVGKGTRVILPPKREAVNPEETENGGRDSDGGNGVKGRLDKWFVVWLVGRTAQPYTGRLW